MAAWLSTNIQVLSVAGFNFCQWPFRTLLSPLHSLPPRGGGGVFFVLILVFISRYMQPEGLWQSALPLPLKATAAFTRYTHFLPPDYHKGVIVGVSQRLLLPRTAGKQRTKEKRNSSSPPEKRKKWSPPPVLLRPLWGGLDLHLDHRLASHLLLGGWGLVLGCLRGLGPLLPARAVRGSPPPRELAGLLLGSTGIGPRPMRALAVGAPGSRMWTPAAPSRPAPPDGAPVIVRGVLLCADGAPGVC